MWNAWIGFNASHSFGAILFGLFYLYGAGCSRATDGILFLQLVGASALAAYAAVAQRYWFRTPLLGILLAFSCISLARLRWRHKPTQLGTRGSALSGSACGGPPALVMQCVHCAATAAQTRQFPTGE